MNYYDEILKEIEDSLNQGDLEQAQYLLKRELSMPYIPPEVEEKLHGLARTLQGKRRDQESDRDHSRPSLEHLLKGLHGTPENQLAAAGELADANLREAIVPLQQYLSSSPAPMAAALVIDALAQQEIQEEFVYRKGDVEYTFYGDSVTPVASSAGLRKGLSLLQKELLNQPSLYQMAKSLMIQKAYLYLPLSYEEEESEELVQQCIQEVETLMHMHDDLN